MKTTSAATKTFRPGVAVVGIFLFVVIGGAFAFVGAEIGYRIYLENRKPANFKQPPESATFWFFKNSPWTYDREVGYRYKPDHIWLYGYVRDGRLLSCDSQSRTDARGNVGSSGTNYDDADLKVLVFGDSVTAQPANNLTYPALLERALTERLGRRVSVMNFGRDGYGVLQMVDLAVREVPRWKPDLVLIDFITDDLDRDRFWRTEMTVDGHARVFTTTIADPSPPPSHRIDTMLLAPATTQEWCNQLMAQQDQSADPILGQLLHAHRATENAISVKPTLWDRDYSVVAEAVRYGDPFAFVWRRIPPTTNPRIRRDHYDDARLVEGLQMLAAYAIPVHYVHLPIHPEIKSGSYSPTMHKGTLLADLERLIGRPVLKNLSYVQVAPEDVDRIRISPFDGAHASPFGMQVYATSLTDMLERNGALNKWVRRAAVAP